MQQTFTEGGPAALFRPCSLCALPLPGKSGYILLRLTQSSFGEFAMKYLSLVLGLCAIAALAATPDRAYAFDLQGENASLQDGSNQFTSPTDQLFNPDFTRGSSLALPYIGKDDGGFVADYGNSIPIPGPGIDKPAPAWAYSPH
jgi:hypothetical protein